MTFKTEIKQQDKNLELPELYAKMGILQIIKWTWLNQDVLIGKGMNVMAFNELINDLAKNAVEDSTLRG